jgi:hypothetical protein
VGDYTRIHAELVLKPEYVKVIELLHHYKRWGSVIALYNEPFLCEWASVFRSDFIPFGAPSEWKLEGAVWTFECELKNYCSEIDDFLRLIVTNIVEEIVQFHTNPWYTDDEYHYEYQFEDGKIVEKRVEDYVEPDPSDPHFTGDTGTPGEEKRK